MSAFAGIDVGSSATKAVVWDGGLRGLGLVHSAADFSGAAAEAFHQACEAAGVAEADVELLCATGYGRDSVPQAQVRRTEIDCHARGAYHCFPREITVIDIGGQDNKVIELDAHGGRRSFSMNRKCAAGTGSFLEEIALRLRVPIDELGAMAARSTDHSLAIGSYCTVFAMTEILAQIRKGVRPEDLARAALASVARRVLEARSFRKGPVVATGGVVAHQPLLASLLADTLKLEVLVPPHPQHIGALGAALFAAKHAQGGVTWQT